MRLKLGVLIGCIGLIIFLGACSDKGKEEDKAAPKSTAADIYNFVPKNSPYVLGNVKPLPEAYLQKMIAMWQQVLPYQTKQLEEQSQKASGQEVEKVFFNLARAALAEMAAIKTPDDMLSKWGISPKTMGVVYGLGLLPALRIQIEEKEKVEQLLARLEEKSGQKMFAADLNGQPYRFIEIKEKIDLKAVLAVTDKHLIAGVVPGQPADQDTFLPLLLSPDQLEAPLTRAAFTDQLSRYKYPGYGDGYIDIKKIASILRGEGEGLNLASFKALATEPDFKWQIGCNLDFNRALFENIPRMVFGVKTITENVFDMEMVLELSANLVETFKKLPQSIPNITAKASPMVALGIGANIPELRNSIQRLLQFVIDNNQNCPDMNTDKLKKTIPKLNMAMNPMISGLQSLIVSIDHMETGENGKPVMDTAGACIALEMNDPRGLVAMGAAFVPALANLNIPPDGTPVALPLEGFPIKLPSLFVAIKDKRLVLSLGKEAQQRTQEAVAGEGMADMPLYWMTYQASAWEQLIKSGLPATRKMNKADREMILEAFEQYKEMFKSIMLAVYVTDNGLSFRESVNFN